MYLGGNGAFIIKSGYLGRRMSPTCGDVVCFYHICTRKWCLSRKLLMFNGVVADRFFFDFMKADWGIEKN